ncbi:helix-turn-helix domain-containing protein [Paenibacillus apiarius]|uniref:Helix-turn-helix domain-containing protein n=1 Tax=Paenibacillus apiarius TaxID=46240 RepID=A0ABT4DRH3_9BACL|nr:helix-turn-helix domain-containing protein [Paenibacillus apiarius]MCY9516630.1 helix-turn-helix domain-containing protein [Paenibacillus apiarius]MCY9519972.1 helix-turn-helix domain-containing protein [Paenibacillus apiarius]MCY9553788.1 helix-turn-helix domain-containing protein [Paenibacillus apiarius]MCY9557602.1 helix-turn-helix domain-containing protein [Paenibacillus apiarius]MCY9685562.1 helix-turn-helix domain-containing protein [Paenibacillus apiarius]
MGYKHLSITERSKLELLVQMKCSLREIAKKLGRHPSTIGREINRGRNDQEYEAHAAQQASLERRASCVPKGKYTSELAGTQPEAEGNVVPGADCRETTSRREAFCLLQDDLQMALHGTALSLRG